MSIIFCLAAIIDPCIKQLYLPNIFSTIYGDISLELYSTKIHLTTSTFKYLLNL